MRVGIVGVKRVIVLAGIAVAMLGVAACGSTPGSPFPTTTTTASTQSGDDGNATSTTTQSGGGSVTAAKPCSLLTESEAESVGLPSQGQSQEVGTSAACEWDSNDYVVVIGVQPSSLAQFQSQGGTVTDTSINGRQAKQDQLSAGDCLVGLAINDVSHADISVTPSGSADACTEALAIAKLVEPKLPSD